MSSREGFWPERVRKKSGSSFDLPNGFLFADLRQAEALNLRVHKEPGFRAETVDFGA
jgi:hypothetical protein